MKILTSRFAMVMLAALFFLVPSAFSKSGGTVHVKGYTRKDGTYVAPHVRSTPNRTKTDNWSTKGNVNPYTGKAGTKDPYSAPISSGDAVSSHNAGGSSNQVAWSNPPTGKTKQEILNLYGEPNIKTAKKWVYSGRGEVQFTDKGVTQ